MRGSFKSGKHGLILLLFILAIMGGVYYYLGGFNPVSVEVVPVQPYFLLGKEFSGSHRSDTLRTYFNQMKALRDSLNLSGPVVLIYDQEPQGPRGMVSNFTGLRLESPPRSTAPGYKIRSVRADSVVRISKDCHAALMPNPSKVESLLQDYLQRNGLVPFDYNLELYYPDNRLVIERPLEN